MFLVSRYDIWLVSVHRSFNAEQQLYTHYTGHTVDVDEMEKWYSREFLETVFSVAHKLKALRMSAEELCVFKGLLILQSGEPRCDVTCA